MNIFTVTTMTHVIHPELKEKKVSRCTPGYYFKLEDAKQCIENNWGDIYEGDFKYAVIEETCEGIYPHIPNEYWYMWEGDWGTGKYVPIEKPEESKNITNNGIG